MTPIDILCFLGEIGCRYTPSEATLAQDYFHRMINDRRVIAIYKEGQLHAITTFSVCFDYTPFWKKKTWDYFPHEEDGTTIYVELLASRNWDKEAREAIQQEILKLYPQVNTAVWHRWAYWGDRKVTWRRQWAMTSRS